MFNPFKKAQEREKKERSFIEGLSYGLGGSLIILVVILAIMFAVNRQPEQVTDTPGADLRITIITSKNCQDCFDINMVLDAIFQADVNETGRETLYIEDKATQKLIDKYQIEKVPSLLIAGELYENEELKSFWPIIGEVVDNVFVFRQLIPPYIETATGNLRGRVEVTYLTDNSCQECYDVFDHRDALTGLGLTLRQESEIDVDSEAGQALVDQYGITQVPTIILTGDVDVYQSVQQIWPMYGTITADGAYVFSALDLIGTYRDLETGEIVEFDEASLTQ